MPSERVSTKVTNDTKGRFIKLESHRFDKLHQILLPYFESSVPADSFRVVRGPQRVPCSPTSTHLEKRHVFGTCGQLQVSLAIRLAIAAHAIN